MLSVQQETHHGEASWACTTDGGEVEGIRGGKLKGRTLSRITMERIEQSVGGRTEYGYPRQCRGGSSTGTNLSRRSKGREGAERQELSGGHTVVNTRGPPDGRFTFTSHEAGDHQICLHSNVTGGWLTTQVIKMYLDINVGSAKHDKEWVSPLSSYPPLKARTSYIDLLTPF